MWDSTRFCKVIPAVRSSSALKTVKSEQDNHSRLHALLVYGKAWNFDLRSFHCKVYICLLLALQCKPNSRQSRQCQTLLAVTKSYLPVPGDFVPDNLHHNRSHIIWHPQPVEGALRVAEPDKQHLYSVWWSRMRIQDVMKIWWSRMRTQSNANHHLAHLALLPE